MHSWLRDFHQLFFVRKRTPLPLILLGCVWKSFQRGFFENGLREGEVGRKKCQSGLWATAGAVGVVLIALNSLNFLRLLFVFVGGSEEQSGFIDPEQFQLFRLP